MDNTIEITKHGDWEVATKKCKLGYTSWAKRGKIQGTNAVNETGQHVWFNFGNTREEARKAITKELNIGE